MDSDSITLFDRHGHDLDGSGHICFYGAFYDGDETVIFVGFLSQKRGRDGMDPMGCFDRIGKLFHFGLTFPLKQII